LTPGLRSLSSDRRLPSCSINEESPVSIDGLRQSLIEEMGEMDVVDTHERVPDEAERLNQQVGFTTLFSHYCRSDLVAAGMPDPSCSRADLRHPGSQGLQFPVAVGVDSPPSLRHRPGHVLVCAHAALLSPVLTANPIRPF